MTSIIVMRMFEVTRIFRIRSVHNDRGIFNGRKPKLVRSSVRNWKDISALPVPESKFERREGRSI